MLFAEPDRASLGRRPSLLTGASGSLSLEMIRSLVECRPAMVTPRWVGTPGQPIVAAEVLTYLMVCVSVWANSPDEKSMES